MDSKQDRQTVVPLILAAFNPLHAWDFLYGRGWQVFAAVGAIVLAITGAEALYADNRSNRPARLGGGSMRSACARKHDAPAAPELRWRFIAARAW